MKNKIIKFVLYAMLYLIAFVFVLPTFLIFTTGNDDSITVWNFVGILWLLMLCWIVGKVSKES